VTEVDAAANEAPKQLMVREAWKEMGREGGRISGLDGLDIYIYVEIYMYK